MLPDLLNKFENMFLDNFEYTSKIFKPLFPYNWYKENDELIFELAVAGYKDSELTIEDRDGYLLVKGKIDKKEKEENFLYKGISTKSFDVVVPFPTLYKVREVTLKDGMLRIFFDKKDNQAIKFLNIKTS